MRCNVKRQKKIGKKDYKRLSNGHNSNLLSLAQGLLDLGACSGHLYCLGARLLRCGLLNLAGAFGPRADRRDAADIEAEIGTTLQQAKDSRTFLLNEYHF